MTWASTVKDSPVPVTYKLESIEELFTDTYMKGYGIKNIGAIKKRIKDLKPKYCEFLYDKGDTDSCLDMTPYIAIKGKEMNWWSGHSPHGVSRDTCIGMCMLNDKCIEVDYEEGEGVCDMNHHEPTQQITQHGIETSPSDTIMIFTTKLRLSRRNLVLNNAKVIEKISPRSSHDPSHSYERQCQRKCDEDPVCAVFTFCDTATATRNTTHTCLLYSEKSLKLDETPVTEQYARGYTTVFVANKPRAAPTDPPITTTTRRSYGFSNRRHGRSHR